MATFITLINFTDQGIKNFKQTAERAQANAALAEKMGGKITALYWTVGPYDLVAVGEFPDEETGTAYLLSVGAQGAIRTTTMRAFNQQEIQGVIAKAQ